MPAFNEELAMLDMTIEKKLIYYSVFPGIAPTKAMLDDLLADRPGDRRSSNVHSRAASFEPESNDRGITFPMFLTMMGEHLYDFDSEAELLEEFESFDENDSGTVRCDEIRKWLADVGEKMDQREVGVGVCLCGLAQFSAFVLTAVLFFASLLTNVCR